MLYSSNPFTIIHSYQLGLFLFHSPLLKKSLLFFLPSLIDMLKLRESSYDTQIFIYWSGLSIDIWLKLFTSSLIYLLATSSLLYLHWILIYSLILDIEYHIYLEVHKYTFKHSNFGYSHFIVPITYRNSLRSSSPRKLNYPK